MACTHCMDSKFIDTYLLTTHSPHTENVKNRWKEKIKSLRVIFFPICIEHHWSLLALCTESSMGPYLIHLNSLVMTSNQSWVENFNRHSEAVQKYSAEIFNVQEVSLHEQQIGKSKVFIPLNPFCHLLPRIS